MEPVPKMRVNIEEKKRGRKLYLKDIHLEFPPGKTTLIIGTSGAGKSTLIKCIIGKTKYKGDKIKDSDKESIAYIPQHPALNSQETPWDALYWSARFSRQYKDNQTLQKAVAHYIKIMGLESVKDSKAIKQLSGGQRQRVSIAKELIRGKSIIIADEIDTGLDCGISRDLVKRLCEITERDNKTTIIISHNIVNLNLYDHVVVLCKDSDDIGRICYSGAPRDIKAFFELTEKEDYIDILTKINNRSEGGMGLADRFIEKHSYLRNMTYLMD